jgi:hypothetical protein
VDQNVKSRGQLADLDPFDLFDAEAARLDRFFGSLDQAGWIRASACQGWSVRDVLGHLAGEEEYNHACLDGTVGQLFARLEREGAGPQGFEVRVDGTTGRLPPDEFVAATVARLPDDHLLDPRLRDALACLA